MESPPDEDVTAEQVEHARDGFRQRSGSVSRHEEDEEAQARAWMWYVNVRNLTLAHELLTTIYLRKARRLNVALVAANTVIGSAIFSSLSDGEYSSVFRIGAGVLSMFVAVMSAVKIQLNYDGRAESHHNAKRGYARVKHTMETLYEVRAVPLVIKAALAGASHSLDLHPDWRKAVDDWEKLESDSPHVPEEYFNAADKRYSGYRSKTDRKVAPAPARRLSDGEASDGQPSDNSAAAGRGRVGSRAMGPEA